MADERKTLHIVSNSHWDREWVYPFEETRLLLLKFMDELLELLDTDPDFHSFTMDSQTLCVEDYLELRPEMRATVEKHVRSGRLIVGPWYSLPEEYIVNGESLVRNLLRGHRSAQALGKVSKVGYTPFSYGQTSQMPQIYQGFDIDTIIFYRGINTPHSEFILEGPDGSRLLGMRFGCLSRFSYYIYVYRMLRYGTDDVHTPYDWDRGAAPFRLAADTDPHADYYILDDMKKQWNDGPIREQLLKLVRDESEHFTTRHICCMQGFDTSNPDPEESRILQMCQELLPEHEIKFSSLAEYMEAMRSEVKDPTVLTGESRDPGATGKWTHLMGDVISARVRLKQANHRAETVLQRLAEPWDAISRMNGGRHEKTALDRCWSFLLQNHPHDTITGAGIDQMEKDSLHRADQVCILGDGLVRRGMQEVQVRIDNSDVPANRSVLTVFNACPFPRKGVISCLVDMPDGFDGESFAVETPAGEPLRVQRRGTFRHDALIRNLQDISAVVSAERTHCHIDTGEIPALGYKTFHIVPSGPAPVLPETLAPETNVLENEHLRVRFNVDGTIELIHKETGRVYPGLHFIEDTGETGHSWIHMEPHDNETITSHGGACALVLEEAGPLLARMRVEYRMMIPAGIRDEITPDFHGDAKNHTRRRADRREIVVTSRFTLRAGARRLDVTTSLDNTCRDHRMRVVFPTGLTGCDRTDAEAGFDVIGRDIRVKEGNAYFGRPNPQYPMHRFVDMTDGKHGLAVLNSSGMREYEAPDLRDRPLAVTLFRAINYRNCPSFGRFDVYPEMERAQCPGDLEWTYALYPHKGDWTNGVYAEAEDLNLPLEPAQCGPHEGTLPKELSFLEVTGPLQLTAFKCAEDRPAGYVVRLFNPAGKAAKGELRLWKPVKKAWLTNLNEERREALEPKNGRIALSVPKKKIVTVEFTL